MSDLRGSQRIESDADVVMILQKRAHEDEEDKGPSKVDGFVVKNRDGLAPVCILFEADGARCTVNERQMNMPVPPPTPRSPSRRRDTDEFHHSQGGPPRPQ